LQITGFERTIVVTDAMAAAGNGPGSYRIGNAYAVVGEDGVPRSPQNSNQLAGSALTMARAAHNLQAEMGLSAPQIQQLLVENPRRLLGA
jgi:N-acetylglucosamine-6-phosphate deacetylase